MHFKKQMQHKSSEKTVLNNNFNFHSQAKFHDLGRPLRVLVATSVRDIGVDDGVGQYLEIDSKKHYMKGTLESLLDATNIEGSYNASIEVVGVIVDDVDGKDRLDNYTVLPERGRQWILPTDYQYKNRSLEEMVHSIPSSFRKLPLADKALRREHKEMFEDALIKKARELQADVFFSDHLIVKLQKVHRHIPAINIHPAITDEASPYCHRGQTPTADTLAMANDNEGTKTGSTLHFINDSFDDGIVISDTRSVHIGKGWSAEKLRQQVYMFAKNPVAIQGLVFFANHFSSLCKEQDLALNAKQIYTFDK